MKSKLTQHKNLNNGKETLIYYPQPDKEFDDQVHEIFRLEHYKEGKVKDGIYVDLGANIGMVAHYFAPYARKYYAVEPSSQCFEALKLNTKDLPNLELFNFAISPVDGEDYLLTLDNNTPPQSFFAFGEVKNQELVKCKTLATFFEENNIEHVDVLKMDTESAEFVILPSDGFAKVADKIDLIVGEAHYNNVGGIPEMVPIILKEYGFKTEFVNLDQPNYIYKLHFTEQDGRKKTYEYHCGTIFVARRENEGRNSKLSDAWG